MLTEHATSPTAVAADLQRAEDLFVSLAAMPDMSYYLGRFVEAGDDELRSVFGLAVVALKRCGRVEAAGAQASNARPAAVQPVREAAPSRRDLEQKLEELAAALAQRDATIRELRQSMKKDLKGN